MCELVRLGFPRDARRLILDDAFVWYLILSSGSPRIVANAHANAVEKHRFTRRGGGKPLALRRRPTKRLKILPKKRMRLKLGACSTKVVFHLGEKLFIRDLQLVCLHTCATLRQHQHPAHLGVVLLSPTSFP